MTNRKSDIPPFGHPTSAGLVLVIGAKGGVGATTVAVELTGALKAVGLDMADGQLAARLERPTWLLSQIAFGASLQRRDWLDQVIGKQATLMWTPECILAKDAALAFVHDLANRLVIIADAGTGVPVCTQIVLPRESGEIIALAETVIIVTDQDNPVAAWHTSQLQKQFKNAIVIPGTKEAARELAGTWSVERKA